MELVSILDPAARLNALITGEVHLIDQVDPATIGMLEGRGVARILSIPGTAHYGFPMDSRQAPYDDNNVRLALKYALDRQAMVDVILGGHGAVSNDNPIGPANRYFNTEMEMKTYDPDRARFHLREAGLDSLDVTIAVAERALFGCGDAGAMFSRKNRAGGGHKNHDPSDRFRTTATGRTSWLNPTAHGPSAPLLGGPPVRGPHVFTQPPNARATVAELRTRATGQRSVHELLVAPARRMKRGICAAEMYTGDQQIVVFEELDHSIPM